MTEERNKDLSFMQGVFEECKMLKTLGLEEKYLTRFIECVWESYKFDYLFNIPKWRNVGNVFYRTLLISLAVVNSIVSYRRIKRLIRFNDNSDTKFIFVPFADVIVKYRQIFDIVPDGLSLRYPPLFKLTPLYKHIEYYNEIGKPIQIGCFSWGDLCYAIRAILKNYARINKLSKQLDIYFGLSSKKIVDSIFSVIVYKHYYEREIKKMSEPSKYLWLLDYDSDPKYIAINQVVHQYRPLDKTIHLQHGMFWNVEDAFSYLDNVADYHFCCCERERRIAIAHNKNNAEIEIYGCPLQSLTPESSDRKDLEYDVLVLLSQFQDRSLALAQVELLSCLKNCGYKILLRYRPATARYDKQYTARYGFDFEVSSGTSLVEDVQRCNMVISFSGDALYEVMRINKRILLVVPNTLESNLINDGRQDSPLKVMNYGNINKSVVRQAIKEAGDCDYKNDIFVNNNFGIFEYNEYKKHFGELLGNLWARL